ncbi:MAG: hypothetical protein V4792_04425 [Pseudomonadota bacterium]
MNLASLRSLLGRHRVAVALWLALLLPCGQAAAAAHLLSHFGAQAESSLGPASGTSLGDAHCDQCLAATAVGMAAPAPQWRGVALIATSDIDPCSAPSAVVDLASRLAYRSRAPPPIPR